MSPWRIYKQISNPYIKHIKNWESVDRVSAGRPERMTEWAEGNGGREEKTLRSVWTEGRSRVNRKLAFKLSLESCFLIV